MKKKNTDIFIEEMEFPNIGIGYFENKKVKVKNTLIGQKVNIILYKKRGNYLGKTIDIIEKSKKEVDYLCKYFNICGGCTYQNINYDYELQLKEKLILDLFKKNNITYGKYLGIEKSPRHKEYRNKMEFSFGDEEKNGKLSIGIRKRNSYYEVVSGKECNIIDKDYRDILKFVTDFFIKENINFYHRKNNTGYLRHLIIRKGFFSKEILINLVTTSSFNLNLDNFTKDILNLKLEGKIVGILHTLNDSLADIIKEDKLNILYGKDWYKEKILDLEFKINAFSFFQTNSQGTEKLYSTVLDFIENEKDKIIFDLYCGTGTITQLLSKKAKKVIGIELSESAINSALENVKLNNITNCKFIKGDVLKELYNVEEKPDIIVLDPPRGGIHPKAIEKILNFNVNKVIYISCNPISLVKDLNLFLQHNYKIEKMKIHDMFPKTFHVEVVVLLKK